MKSQLKFQSTNVVLRGSFNPSIFQPQWLASQELIRPQEADAAEIEIIHPQITKFMAEWLQLNVTMDRFQALTAQEHYFEPLRDLVHGVFYLLNNTPIRVIGINWDYHYGISTEKAWHSIGDQLVPKFPWQDVLNNPGMKGVVLQGTRPDKYGGYIQVKVEPLMPHTILVSINDHYELPSADRVSDSATEAIAILKENWTSSKQTADKIAQKLSNLGETE